MDSHKISRTVQPLCLFGLLVYGLLVTPAILADQGPPPPGETVYDPIYLSGLPVAETGTTCNWYHDYDEVCPYAGGSAPDVVYAYVTNQYDLIDIYLCHSSYDTKIYIYENDYTPGNPLRCSDDSCSGPHMNDYVSFILNFSMEPGKTYLFVIDGYGEGCGDYELYMSPGAPCFLNQLPGAIAEGESICYDGYYDTYNSGCTDPSHQFTYIPPSPQTVQIIGSGGNYQNDDGFHGDNDWYQLEIDEASEITYTLRSEFPAEISLFDGGSGCQSADLLEGFEVGRCDVGSNIRQCDPGTYWLRIRPTSQTGAACGMEYTLTLDGYGAGLATAEEQSDSPLVSGISMIYPDPFVDTVTLRYHLAAPDRVSIQVLDVSGRLVRTLLHQSRQITGQHQVRWDGSDDSGVTVGGGLYLMRLQTNVETFTSRVLKLD
jgi:FlgD Ig-like domain